MIRTGGGSNPHPSLIFFNLIKSILMQKKLNPIDRFYRLMTKATPLSFFIPAAGSRRIPLLYWDDDTGTNRVMRYSPNQKSIFEDEQDANVLREPIIFIDGLLHVPRTNPLLQEFLALHPLNGKKFEEINEEKEAADEIATLNAEVDALIACRELDIEQVENIVRVAFGVDPSNQTSAELRRDLLIFAKNNPGDFLQVLNDPNLSLQSNVKGFFSNGLLSFRRDKTEIWFSTPSNKKKMITIPFGNDPYHACEQYFLTDEGLESLQTLESYLSKK